MDLHDILNLSGDATGEQKPLAEIHSLGLLHGVVHVWIINSQNQILLQRRSAKKVINPLMFDFTAGGHINVGEDFETAAIRESQEEIGLDITKQDLIYVCTTHVALNITDLRKPGIHNHLIKSFIVKKDIEIKNLKIDTEEVEEMLFMDLAEFKSKVEQHDPEIAEHAEEYEKLYQKKKTTS